MTPFASSAFRWLWVSTLASSSASGVLSIAMAWLAVNDPGGGFSVGIVAAARMLPGLLFGLVAGTLADRFPRPRQLVVVSLAALPMLLLLNRLAASGSVALWQLAVLSFTTGCLSVFDVPARQALVLDVVPRTVAPNAMALNALAGRLCVALGGLAGGLLIPVVGPEGGFLVAAGLYLLAGGLLVAVRPRASTSAWTVRASFGRALREAARLIVDVRAVRTLIIGGVACEIFGFSFATALPVFARDVLSAGAEGLGILNAATSIGGTFAVVALSLVPGQTRREPLLGSVFVIYGLSLVLLAATDSLIAAAAVLLITGACAASFDLLQQTLVQLAVPEEQRGRAVGVWVLGIGSAPIGHIEMGALVASLGAPPALMINGVVVLVSAIVLLARAPHYRLAQKAS